MKIFIKLAALLCFTTACNPTRQLQAEPQLKIKTDVVQPEAFVVSSKIPGDVNIKKKDKFTKAGKFPLVQRLFDEYSWRAFIALNWPTDKHGKPKKSLEDKGVPFWTTYSEAYEIFKLDGSKPDPYGATRVTPPPITSDDLPNVGTDKLSSQAYRLLHQVNATTNLNILDEVNQAFSSPLWDQNGNIVHYEVLVNKVEYDYLLKNQLYNIQGQVAFFKKNGAAQFPSGTYGGTEGAIEIKLAWKTLTKDDIKSRYFTQKAMVVQGSPPRWTEVLVGLVGMHISQKTKSSPQWIWSTFEHVDNLRVNDYAAFGPDAENHPKVPSFNDPGCEYCPTNTVPTPDTKGALRTQVTRVVPIPKATESYNRQIQALLAQQGSVLQYYELVNTQWPTEPSSPPASISSYPDNITNKSGGKPTPVFLVNTTMETYFQGGAAGTKVNLVVDDNDPVSIPSTNGGNVPLNFAEGFCISVGDECGNAGKQLVLSTESCMGCHSSAPIATSISDTGVVTWGSQLSADFSWLLKQKAQLQK